MKKEDRYLLEEEDGGLEFYETDPDTGEDGWKEEDQEEDFLNDLEMDPYARRGRGEKTDRRLEGKRDQKAARKADQKEGRKKGRGAEEKAGRKPGRGADRKSVSDVLEEQEADRYRGSRSWKEDVGEEDMWDGSARDGYARNRPSSGRKPARRRRGGGYWIKTVFAMIGVLTVMVAVMYAGIMVYTRFQEAGQGGGNILPAAGMQDGEDIPGGSGEDVNKITLDENGNVISAASGSAVYSQEELDAKVAEAVLAAQNQGQEEVLGSIMTGLSQGDTVLETLRPLYPDHLVVGSGGKYHFVPINHALQMNQLSAENLNILESGEFQYLTEGQVSSHKGIDVSKHQGEINWNQVAADGVEFAFIRVGFRGYGAEGKLVEDEYFDRNIQGAQAAGIKTGVYFYSQAITEAEVLEEAQLVIDKLASYTLQCPVVFDVERVSGSDGRMNKISVEERTRFTALFCQTIENAGYRPMIYHNTEMGSLFLDLPALEAYDKWFASYSDSLYYPYEYKVWQYSQSGSVQGIKGAVDLNISFAPLWTE